MKCSDCGAPAHTCECYQPRRPAQDSTRVSKRVEESAWTWLRMAANRGGPTALYYTRKSNFDKTTRDDVERVIVNRGWGEWRNGYLYITDVGRGALLEEAR